MDGNKLNRHLEYIRNDFRGEFCFVLNRVFLKLYCYLLCWPWNILKCVLVGIRISLKTRFYGNIIFYRFPLSRIQIGPCSTFNNSNHLSMLGVNHPCIISTQAPAAKIEIGNNCGFSGVAIAAAKYVEIGNNVLCGVNVVINDFDWHTNRYPSDPKPVVIRDNVWLGANVMVMKGVTIGENTIIGANSIVTKSIPANMIAAGNPCRVLKNREEVNEK